MPDKIKDDVNPGSSHWIPIQIPIKTETSLGLTLHHAVLFSFKTKKLGLASNGELYPTIVGYPEDGILSGILPGNAKMLHGDEAIANELHLRLVYPLSDGVIGDFDVLNHTCTIA